MRLNADVSKRIAMLRPLLIIGVVFVHVYGVPDAPSQLHWDIFDLFAGFFKDAVFRGTVPTMSIIAGYLLFNSGIDSAPRKLFDKKFFSLVIPFIVFNIYYLGFTLGMNLIFRAALPYPDIFHAPLTPALAKMFGLFGYPLNLPLYFLRDLIVTIAFVPILSVMIRKAPWMGLILLMLVFGSNIDGVIILRPTSLILFYIGGIAAVYKWNVLALDKFAVHCFIVFVSLCIGIITLRIDDNTFLVVVAPFLIWPAARLLVETRIGAWAIKYSNYSFFIFAAHAPLLVASWWAFTHFTPQLPYPVYWLTMPFIVVVLLKFIYDYAMKIAPRAFNTIVGARLEKAVLVDRRRAPRPASAPVYSEAFRLTLEKY